MTKQPGIEDNALLRKAAENPPENYVVIIGGTGAADKIRYISKFMNKAKKILIGGSVAHTFLAARGESVGNSKIAEDCFEECREILKKAKDKKVRIVLPSDHIAALRVEPEVTIKMIKEEESIPDDMMGLDIGFDTIRLFSDEIPDADLIVWYAPLGVYEIDTFSAGTAKIAEAVVGSSADSIIIGEELIKAFGKAGLTDRVSYKTTASAAVLEFLTAKVANP
ncbi:MAG: phosphoglycerate kinase [Candidatus Aminicenantes bacterium]|nr:phosphoglycerate kinase [Candidatus Aminicenantes bacterium]